LGRRRKRLFAAEGLDFELNVEGGRKNTPRLATVDSPGALEDSRFGAFDGTRRDTDAKAKARAT
jgi:hypothetical protein